MGNRQPNGVELVPFQLDGEPGWERLSQRTIYTHPYVSLEEVTYRSPNREDGVSWVVARRKPGAVIAPRLADGRFLLIRQERYPIQRVLWEFPAGLIDESDYHQEPERIVQTALRELKEETGYQLRADGRLNYLGYFFSSQGFTDEHVYLFVAEGVEPSQEGPQHEQGETILECRPFSLEDLREMIAAGEILDANSQVLYAKLCATGGGALS